MASPQDRQTHSAAQFSVAGELLKRGYAASLLLGSGGVDISVTSPETKTPFYVAVRGIYRKNAWLTKRQPAKNLLFYVLAFLPPDLHSEYFIMTQEEVREAIESDLKRLGRPDDYPVTGVDWKLAQRHHDAWDKLPR